MHKHICIECWITIIQNMGWIKEARHEQQTFVLKVISQSCKTMSESNKQDVANNMSVVSDMTMVQNEE